MTEQNLIQDILLKEYRDAKARNPSFSQRAFAKRLGLSSGAMSSIFNGKRNVSKDMALKLLEGLGTSPKQKSKIIEEFTKPSSQKPVKRSVKERLLSMDQFEVIADGIHFSLLCLMETKSFTSSSKFMAARLGKSVKEVKLALKRLERLELIFRDEKDNFSSCPIEVCSPDDVVSSSLKQSHVESMEQAKESLFKVPIDQREFTSQTIAVSSEKVKLAKELIKRFGDEFAEIMDTDNGTKIEKDEVYKINIQFFPMTEAIS